MSLEKRGSVKSELSPDGALKLTIKREKMTDDAHKLEWVTEARGNGIGKIVFKRKSPGSVSQPPKTTGLHVDRQNEQRPILRLSLTSSASSHVKSWSSCEVLSAVEDVGSVSELSPACQLQPSPKDSGIDISSPPHDDGAVSVEPNAGTGIWSANDSHSGDSSSLAVEEEKITNNLEKLETDVVSFVHANNNAVDSSSKAVWSGTASHNTESNGPKVQSTLRSRGERFNLKLFPSNSQKLVNPLAKTHRVGRYQHMLPVNRIRAESNVTRRSSLEESPTYNMAASRTSLLSRLPRLKTKFKLLSNNTYTPVFGHEMDSNKHHAAATDRKSKRLNVGKPSDAVMEHKRNRFSCKLSASNAFEKVEVKCFGSESNQNTLEGEKIQKVPKLKLVVKSEPALSISHVGQRLKEESFTDAVKHAEENVRRHAWRKRRYCEVEKTKACRSNASENLRRPVSGFNASHLPSSKAADIRSSHLKRKSSEAKQAEVADVEPAGKKSKEQSCAKQLAKQLANHLLVMSESQQSLEDHCDKTVQPVHGKATVDEAVCDVVTSLSVMHTDKPCTDQIVVDDASKEPHAAVQEEAGNSDSVSTDASKSSASSTELDSNGVAATACSRVESDREKQCSESAHCDSEQCTVSNFLTVNADDEISKVDGQLEEKSSVSNAKEEPPTPTAVQRDFSSDCIAACDESAVNTDTPSATIADVTAGDRPTTDTSSDQSAESHNTCAVFDEDNMSAATEQSTAVCSDAVVPLSSPLLLAGDNSVTESTTSALAVHSHESDISKAEVSNLSLTQKPAVVTEDTISCDTMHSQNSSDVVSNRCSTDSAKLDHQYTECQKDITEEMVDANEFSEKGFGLKSASSVSDQDQKPDDGLEQTDSAFSFDQPNHLIPLSAPHTETTVDNSACSGSFLAVFTQFVEKASVKKKSTCCKPVETDDNTSKSSKEILSKSGSSQKCVRQRPHAAQRRRRTCSEKQALLENRLPHRVVRHQSTSTVECVLTEEAPSLETCSSEDIDYSKRLPSIAGDSEHPMLSREELLNAVASDRQLVKLRHRVCELFEAILPDFQFPSDLQRDSASVERLVKDITDILSNSEAQKQDVQQCSDPVVVLHCMPDSCLQSFQQQIIRLLSLLLPDVDLSDISGDSLDVFLELVTSENRPLPGSFCVSQANLQLSRETCTHPLNKLQLQGHPSSPCSAETDFKCEQIDTLLSRTENHMTAVDTLFGMPSSLLPVSPQGPTGDKRSIRRQVKDCLMLLDRDLT